MPVNMFETRTMLRAVEIMNRPGTFLRERFFAAGVQTFATEHVDVDIVKGKRRMALFVNPNLPGQPTNRAGYETRTYKAPMIKPKMETNAEHLLRRLPGEPLYSGVSPDERAQQQLGRDLGELDDLITRREEWMCAQALFTGKLIMKGEGYNETVDFGLTHKEALAGQAIWTDYANSDPYKNLREWRLACMKDSGVTPNTLLMASDVVDIFTLHPKIKDRLDLRRLEVMGLAPVVQQDGVTYLGRLNDLGLDIFSYDNWYLDDQDNNTEKPFVPAKTIWMGSTNARFDLLYGGVPETDDKESIFVIQGERVPRSWTEKDPPVRWVQLCARPLPVPHEIDSMYVATVY